MLNYRRLLQKKKEKSSTNNEAILKKKWNDRENELVCINMAKLTIAQNVVTGLQCLLVGNLNVIGVYT